MKVYIGVPTAEIARYAVFYDYLALLNKPKETVGANFHTNSGAYNRNIIIDDALAAKASHILFIDDDMAFPHDALTRLLKHDVDIVSGLYFNRAYPHPPAIFNLQDGFQSRRYLNKGEQGLIEVDACGFGFLLVKTYIFGQLDKPYVRVGEVEKDKRDEDIGFCIRAKKAGFRIHCDLDCVIGHIGVTTIWPNNVDGTWFTGIDTGGTEIFNMPQETSQEHCKIKTPLTYTSENDMYAHMLDLMRE